MSISQTATEVAKGLGSNPSCLAAVALAALMAGLTYMALRDERAAANAQSEKRQQIILELLQACPLKDKNYLGAPS